MATTTIKRDGVLISILFYFPIVIVAQKNLISTDSLTIAAIKLTGGVFTKDTRKSHIAAGKIKLELETGTNTIVGTEIYYALNNSKNRSERPASIKKNITDHGWSIHTSTWDSSYYTLTRNNETLVMYLASTKKRVNLYLGRSLYSATGDVPNIIGNWGKLSSNLIDNYTIAAADPGISMEVGLELYTDGTYTKMYFHTENRGSGRSGGRGTGNRIGTTYKSFLYEKGSYIVTGNRLVLTPKLSKINGVNNRYVESEQVYRWNIRLNKETGKLCLYLLQKNSYTLTVPEVEYCKQ